MSESLTASGLTRFTEVAAGHVADDGVPGLVAAVVHGDQEHVVALGSLTVGGAPVRRDSQFRISSTTKPVTGAATLALVDEGLIGLDDAVARWLPELARPRVLRRIDGPVDETVDVERAITVRDLLTFTFGFGAAFDMYLAPEPWPIVAAVEGLGLAPFGPPDPGGQPDPDTWMARLASVPLMAQPGARWLYNTGASVLGVLLSRAAGVPFEEVLRTRIFAPLGMVDTAFRVSEPGRLATLYRSAPTGIEAVDAPGGEWSRSPAFPDGAGGLVSTVDDLLALARMYRSGGGNVLSVAAVAELTRDQLTASQRMGGKGFLDEGTSWALCQGVVVEGGRAGSYGWDGGLGSSWSVDPVRDLTVVVLAQRFFDGPQGPQVVHDLREAAYAALG